MKHGLSKTCPKKSIVTVDAADRHSDPYVALS